MAKRSNDNSKLAGALQQAKRGQVNVSKLKLQVGPTTPKPGALLLDKKRKPR